jgi:hypothetical protein
MMIGLTALYVLVTEFAKKDLLFPKEKCGSLIYPGGPVILGIVSLNVTSSKPPERWSIA